MYEDFQEDLDDRLMEEYRESSCGFPLGLTFWVTGVIPEERVSSRGGPYPGISIPPPSLSGGRGKRKGGRAGRPKVEHPILDAAKVRLLRYSPPTGDPPKKDVLERFRKVVWFLLLASYSPNLVMTFFKDVFPDYYRKLSYRGTRSSVMRAQFVAAKGKLLVDKGFQDILKEYRAGPWAHDAPDWLRAQYGVPLAEPKSGGKDSRKGKGKDSGKDVAGEPEMVVAGEDLDRQNQKEFLTAWIDYKKAFPETPDLTPDEIVLGVKEGFCSVLLRRSAASVSVGAVAGEAPVVPVVGSGVVSPSVAAVSAVPGGSVVAEERSARIATVFEEVTQLEARTGVPLNLTTVEFLEAVDSGLPFVLTKRLGSGSSGGSVSAGSTVAPAVKESAVPAVPAVRVVPGFSGVSGNDFGGDSVGDGKPVDSHGVDSAVAKGSGDLVSPVEPVVDSPGKDPVSPVPVGSDAPGVSEAPKEKKVFARRASVLDPVPESEWLRFNALGIAPGVRGGPDVDPLNIGGVPRVWIIDEDRFIKAGVEPSDFYKSLGAAAPYLVDHVEDTKYGGWVLTGDNGFALRERFGGDSPKERLGWSGTGPDAKFNWGGEIFPTFFPELNAAPKSQREMYDLTLEQAKACFEEWNQLYDEDTPEILNKDRANMSIVCPGPMLMDLVNRGMGPDYWKGHDTFLAHWLLGLAVRQACGFSTSWAHQGGKRYIPLAVVPSLEKVSYACKNSFDAIAPWRSVSPIYTETLAPRRASENLPGHVWAAGLGYFRVEDYERFKAYAGKRNENHKDLAGLRAEERMMMTNWCLDIVHRVSTRNWESHEKAPDGGHYFLDTWDPRGDQLASASDGVNRLTCSPLFCDSGRVSGYFSRMSHSLLNNDLLVGNGALRGLLWPPKSGFVGLEETWAKLPLDIHMYSLYAVGYYLQHLENRRPRGAKGVLLRGVLATPDYLLPEDKVPFPPVQIANSLFRRWFKQMVIDKEVSGS